MLHLLTHRCTIERSTPQNYDGVIRHEWAAVATEVPFALQEAGGGLRMTRAGELLTQQPVGFFLGDVDLRPNANADQADRIVVTQHPRLTGAIFRVTNVVDESGRGHHLVASLERSPDLTPQE